MSYDPALCLSDDDNDDEECNLAAREAFTTTMGFDMSTSDVTSASLDDTASRLMQTCLRGKSTGRHVTVIVDHRITWTERHFQLEVRFVVFCLRRPFNVHFLTPIRLEIQLTRGYSALTWIIQVKAHFSRLVYETS